MSKKPWNIFFCFWAWAGEPNPVPVPISYYTMDEWSGTTAFDSVGSNDFALSNTSWGAWKINTWLDFNWTNSKWDWPISFTVNSISSYSFWYKTNSTWSRLQVLWWYKTTTPTTQFWIILNYRPWTAWATNWDIWVYNFRSDLWNTERTFYSTIWPTLYDWNWHHIVIVLDNTIDTWWEIYFNWVKQTKVNVVNNTLNNYTIPLWLWYRRSLNDHWFNWQIDEVWIWNQALTQEQITYLYNSWNGARPPFS